MSIRSEKDLQGLRAIGKIVRLALDTMGARLRPGMSTAEINETGAQILQAHGARSAPPQVYGFPGDVCISVNEEAIHGIPGSRTVEEGDLVKLDLVAEKDGYYADAAVTVPVGRVSELAGKLIGCAASAFHQACRVARTGYRAYDIGRAVERETVRQGFSVIRELCGHGVGRSIHEEPTVPNYYDARFRNRLHEGMVITIEPIIAAGRGQARVQPDRWTVVTADGSLSAHYEHTLVVTRGEPILVTG